MRAVIVGGGVAGPALGLALLRAGIESVVLERRQDRDPEEGSYFTVSPNGLDALDAVGALHLAREAGFGSRNNTMYGATGRLLGRISLGVPLRDGTVALTLKRSRLAVLLADEAERQGVEVRRGARVVSVTGGAGGVGGVSATLEDGTTVRGDVLVGADGVHSLVRRTIDPASPAGRYVGLTNFGGITRSTPVAAVLEPEAWHFVFGSGAFIGAHPTPEGDVVWFANVPRAEISREERSTTSHEQWRQWLLERVRDDAGPAAELISHGELELAGDNTYDLPHVPTWSRDAMVVIGDAAHAPSPSSGQGASMALEDAVVLAQALRDSSDVPTALAAYEQARRARVEKIVAVGERSGSSKIPGRIGRRVQDVVLRLVFRYAVTEKSTAWMSGHRIDWDAQLTR
jgi:2-polyprenyl-6-methoxyphenol hydroxylase-like FAD-dependent oxidoreductase